MKVLIHAPGVGFQVRRLLVWCCSGTRGAEPANPELTISWRVADN
jgi:hypothetical protein